MVLNRILHLLFKQFKEITKSNFSQLLYNIWNGIDNLKEH